MQIIQINSLRQCPAAIRYKAYTGSQEECAASFYRHFPDYDPGTAYYHLPTRTLYVPMEFDATAKLEEVNHNDRL